MTIRVITICVVLIPTEVVTAQSATYSQRFSIGPVRITHQRFVDVVKRVERFAASVNGDSIAVYRNEAVISDGSRDVRATGAFIDSLPRRAPDTAYSARYEFLMPVGRISSVDIDLADASREVRVTGNSPESVDAVTSMLREDLSVSSHWIGGTFFRSVAGAMMLLLTMLIPSLAPKARPIHAVAAQLVVACAVFLLPWQHWFPGTGLYSASASWLARNSPELGLVGIVLSIVLFTASPWLSRMTESRRKASEMPSA